MAIFRKEWREIVSNKLLLGVVAAPALIFAAIPTLIVALIQVSEINTTQLGQIEAMLAAFPDLPPKLAAQGFIVSSFMAYFLLIPPLLAKTVLRNFFIRMGFVRFFLLVNLLQFMAALPIKMVLRWVINLKYIVYIPELFFNI